MHAVLHLSSGEQFETFQSLDSIMESIKKEQGRGTLTFSLRDEQTGELGTKVIFMSHIVSITDY